jgi:hypothetical protein
MTSIKLFESVKITKNGKYEIKIYTEDMQTFKAVRFRNNKMEKMYIMTLHEKVTTEEIMETQTILMGSVEKYSPWKLIRMLIVVAIVHARMKHNTRKVRDIYRMIQTEPKISAKVITHTIREYGL